MRRHPARVAGVLTLALALPASAQSLAERVARAPAEQDVSFEFPAHPEVCGYGDAIIRFHDRGSRGYSTMYFNSRSGQRDPNDLDRDELRRLCQFGPVRVRLDRTGAQVSGLRIRVGGENPPGVLSLGSVSVAEAAEYLTGLARAGRGSWSDDGLAALPLADGEYWPPLLRLARDRDAPKQARKSAIFWLGQAAGEKATEGLHGILSDDSDELEIRKQAVFALSQNGSGNAVAILIDVAETSREPEIRKNALFWLGQNHEDPRVLALFERILLDRR